jgi:hypothetical protein
MAQWFQEQLEDFYSNMLTTLFCTGSIVLNKKQATRINEVQKQSTHSELYFCFWFHFNTLSGCKKTKMEALLTEHPV